MDNIQEGNLYLNYLLRNYPRDIADSILYEANGKLYYYGDHFKIPNRNSILFKIKSECSSVYSTIFKSKSKTRFLQTDKCNILCSENDLLSSSLNTSFALFNPPWMNSSKKVSLQNSTDFEKTIEKIKSVLTHDSLNELLSEEFLRLIYEYKSGFKSYLKGNKIKAVILPYDLPFFENISIQCARELNIPTYIFLHGLPARYNSIDDNRADYLMVWGDAIKENYIKAGFKSEKILVTGHPFYSGAMKRELRSTLEDIVVITKTMCGGQHSDKIRLMDRSFSLYYLEKIRDLLQSLGVKKARLRCHPSEDPSFYRKHLTDTFFEIDVLSKVQSLTRATLVIGPASTMILDALKFGVNYIMYEPNHNGKSLTHFDIVPPFEGTHFISATDTVNDFKKNLDPQININFDLVNEYTGNKFSLDSFRETLNTVAVLKE